MTPPMAFPYTPNVTQAAFRFDDRTQASTNATPATPSLTLGKMTSGGIGWPA